MSLSHSNLTKNATTNYYNNTQLGKNDTLMTIKIFEVEFRFYKLTKTHMYIVSPRIP